MSSNQRGIDECPTVAVRSNWLRVNNRTLRTDVLEYPGADKIPVSPEELERVLVLGRHAVLQVIERFYLEQTTKNPNLTISRPSIWTAQLGTSAQVDGRLSEVFTEKGYMNGGTIQHPDEVHDAFRDHWDAVKHAGFLPEVRRTTTVRDGGAWLLLRKPTTDEILRHWIGWGSDMPDDVAEIIQDDDMAVERRKLRVYRTLGERAVDEAPDIMRTRAQIGLLLAMASVKRALGDREGYEQELDELFVYADNAPDTDIAIYAVRAIENSVFALPHMSDE